LRTLAIIPARGGSARLPGKNIRPFLGRPLIHWSIEFARTIPQFEEIFVSTDSEEIAEVCEVIGHRVRHRRPQELASDTASSVDVALEALETAERSNGAFDTVALLQPTSPIRERARWDEAFRMIEDESCDAVVGVSPARTHPWHTFKHLADNTLVPWGGHEGLGVRSQDLPPAVNVCGALYLIRASSLRNLRTFFPERSKGILCSAPYESIDIDTEDDWITAEALVRHYGKTA
jgi:N-acylneuraminate cytidylyltransferase